MSRNLRYIFLGISILILAFLYIIAANWNYLVHNDNTTRPLLQEKVELVNWDLADGVLYSKEDSQIEINSVNGYVDSLDITCTLVAGEFQPVVYYTTLPFQGPTEEKSFIPEYTYQNGVLNIKVERYVNDIRFDPSYGTGFSMTLGESIANYGNIYIDGIYMLSFMLIGFISIYFIFIERGRTKVYILGFQKYSYLLSNLVRRDITKKYRRSVLGILWSVLNPLLMMLVMTAVFRDLFRFEVENFSIYYLTGLLIFNLVAEATTGAMASILDSGALIRKVYIPKYLFPVEKCIFAMVNMLFSMIAIAFLFLILDFPPPITILLFPIPIIFVLLFSVGLGMILATMNVFFRDINHLYSVWITAWMFLTPIVYPENILPYPVLQFIRLNPLYYYVDYFRQLVMYGTIPDLKTNAICFLYSIGFLVVGIAVFKKNQDKFILYI